MEFLKKDINKTLLLLILIPLLLFTCFSIYYQNTLKNISTEYGKNREQLEKITGKLFLQETKANETSGLKEIIQKDKEVLEKSYNELKNENEVLKQELSSTKIELEKTNSELQEEKTKFNLLKAQFDQVQQSLVKANEEIGKLIAKVRELCSSGCSDDEC